MSSKMFGGRSAEEVHRKVAWRGRRCVICGGPPALRIKVLVQLAELMQRAPEFLAEIIASNPAGPQAGVPTVATTYGDMVKVSDCVFCDRCKAGAEREAARGPSYALVEIQCGPGADPIVSQVPEKLRAASRTQ